LKHHHTAVTILQVELAHTAAETFLQASACPCAAVKMLFRCFLIAIFCLFEIRFFPFATQVKLARAAARTSLRAFACLVHAAPVSPLSCKLFRHIEILKLMPVYLYNCAANFPTICLA
jgi:hypothetical protein